MLVRGPTLAHSWSTLSSLTTALYQTPSSGHRMCTSCARQRLAGQGSITAWDGQGTTCAGSGSLEDRCAGDQACTGRCETVP